MRWKDTLTEAMLLRSLHGLFMGFLALGGAVEWSAGAAPPAVLFSSSNIFEELDVLST